MNLSVTGLPKKIDSYLVINFANFWNSTTSVIKGEISPSWLNEVFTFDYSSADASNFHNKYLVFEVWNKSLKSKMVGYVQVDLLTLASGPVTHDLPLLKKKKGDTIVPLKSGRIQFGVEMVCTAEATVSLSDISCTVLRLAQNRPTAKWQNDAFLQLSLFPDPPTSLSPPNSVKSIVCYNTTKPTWSEVPPLTCKGTLKEILNHIVCMQVYNWNRTQPEILGECKFPLAKYYTYDESEMYVKEPLLFQNAPFGKIRACLVIHNLPEFAQMEGGIHNEDGVFDAIPIISEAVKLHKVFTKLSLMPPLISPPKRNGPDIRESAPVPIAAKKTQDTIEELIKQLPDDESAAEKLAQLAESETEVCAKIFRHCGIIEKLLPMVTHSNSNVAFRIVSALAAVCVKNSKNLEHIHRRNGIPHLLKALTVADEKMASKILAILQPLSIRDSHVQELFRKESTIPMLIDLLLKAKTNQIIYPIVVILGNLCYGISGGEPSNKEVIYYAGGIPILVSLLLRRDPILTKKIFKTFDFLTQDSPENLRTLIRELSRILVDAHVNAQDSEFFILLLTGIDKFFSKSRENASHFISEVGSLLVKLLASENQQLVQQVEHMLDTYSTEESNIQIVSAFLSTLFLSDKKQKILSLTYLNKLLDKPNLRPKIQEVSLKENPFVPLIALLQDNNTDPTLLILGLQFLKNLSINGATVVAKFFELGGEVVVARLVELLNHENLNIRSAALDFIVISASVLAVQIFLLKYNIFEVAKKMLDHEYLPLRIGALELIRCLVYNSDIQRKNLFLNVVGLDKMKQLLFAEPDTAIHVVRILHCLCFPLVPENQPILEAVIQSDILSRFIAILNDPLLLAPHPHPILITIINALKSLCTLESVMRIIDEKGLADTLVKLTKLPPNVPVSHEASNALRTLGYPGKLCTYLEMRTVPIAQQYAECKTCALTGPDGICIACAETCHRGHEVVVSQKFYSFYCNCGNSEFCNSKVLQKNPAPVNVCTFVYTDKIPRMQYAYQCNTCFVLPSKCICLTCVKRCHQGHIIVFQGAKKIVCVCNERFGCCRARKPEERNQTPRDTPAVTAPETTKKSEDSGEAKEDNQICAVCLDKPKDTVFYRCGHLACCHNCALSLKRMRQPCPICRSPIQDCIKLYQV
jgi:hypothetical protein